MKLKIAVLAGDGIGPEISKVGVDVMNAVAKRFGHEITYTQAICGAAAIDEVGDPFPEETFRTCQEADAVFSLPWAIRNLITIPLPRYVPNRGCLQCVRNWGFTRTFVLYKLFHVCFTNPL